MKKINLLIASVVALLVFASCGAGSNDNVYTKKAAVYKAAIKKLNAASDAVALNEVNANLEKEIAAINIECEAEYERIFEEKRGNIDAYKESEDALKAAQTEYDDLYVERFMELKNL
ncbi:MAG: hypothetical protein IKW29_06310 [Bacteroidaceae bacterium]|nr:hypothetical protein [Bacteroidaceae bacterium]